MSVFSVKLIFLATLLDTEQKGQVERRYSYLRLLSSFFSVFAVKETQLRISFILCSVSSGS